MRVTDYWNYEINNLLELISQCALLCVLIPEVLIIRQFLSLYNLLYLSLLSSFLKLKS
jgi:hypothetical protein